MNPYYILSDILMGLGFLGMATLAGYRFFKQGCLEPEFQHLYPIGICYLLSGAGCFLRDTWPPAALLSATGVLGAMGVLWWYVRALMAQPTMADVMQVFSRVSKVECVVKEILDHVTPEEEA